MFGRCDEKVPSFCSCLVELQSMSGGAFYSDIPGKDSQVSLWTTEDDAPALLLAQAAYSACCFAKSPPVICHLIQVVSV